MNKHGIVRQQERMDCICPFCHNRLSAVEYAKRRALKICKCRKCGLVIDERILMH
jgi:ribosomal protein L37AE/L43A